MVAVTCSKTGLSFDAESKRQKNHPAISRLLSEASHDDWYTEAQEALEAGRAAGFTTIDEFVTLLRDTGRAAVAARIAANKDRHAARSQRNDAWGRVIRAGFRPFRANDDDEEYSGDLAGQWVYYDAENILRPVF